MGVMNEIAAELGRVQDEVLRLRPEIDRLRRNEEDILARAHQAGYSTPHGESDSITEAVAWMAAELTRLREIEAAARKAGQITRDGKFAKINGSVWHPNEDCMGAVRVHPCGSPQWADFLHIDDWDIHYNKVTSHPLSECYSTPEAAQAAKEAKK